MENKIHFRIDRTGQVHIDVDDTVVGADCETITRKFEEALGVKIDTNLKPQYYEILDNLKIEVNEE